jgi:hypothetical protein
MPKDTITASLNYSIDGIRFYKDQPVDINLLDIINVQRIDGNGIYENLSSTPSSTEQGTILSGENIIEVMPHNKSTSETVEVLTDTGSAVLLTTSTIHQNVLVSYEPQYLGSVSNDSYSFGSSADSGLTSNVDLSGINHDFFGKGPWTNGKVSYGVSGGKLFISPNFRSGTLVNGAYSLLNNTDNSLIVQNKTIKSLLSMNVRRAPNSVRNEILAGVLFTDNTAAQLRLSWSSHTVTPDNQNINPTGGNIEVGVTLNTSNLKAATQDQLSVGRYHMNSDSLYIKSSTGGYLIDTENESLASSNHNNLTGFQIFVPHINTPSVAYRPTGTFTTDNNFIYLLYEDWANTPLGVGGNSRYCKIFKYTRDDYNICSLAVGEFIIKRPSSGGYNGIRLESMLKDSSGNFFFFEEHLIKKVTPSGVVSTFAGSSIPDYLDGSGTNARFGWIFGAAIDSNNNIYVCEQPFEYRENGAWWGAVTLKGKHAIRKITPSGVVSTLYQSTTQNPFSTESISLSKNGFIHFINTAVRPPSEHPSAISINHIEGQKLGRLERISLTGQNTPTTLYGDSVMVSNSNQIYVHRATITYGAGAGAYAGTKFVTRVTYKVLDDNNHQAINGGYTDINYGISRVQPYDSDGFIVSSEYWVTFLKPNADITSLSSVKLSLDSRNAQLQFRPLVGSKYKVSYVEYNSVSNIVKIPYDTSESGLLNIFSDALPQGTTYSKASTQGMISWSATIPNEQLNIISNTSIPKYDVKISYIKDTITPSEIGNPTVSYFNRVATINLHLNVGSVPFFRLYCDVQWTLLQNFPNKLITKLKTNEWNETIVAEYSDGSAELLWDPTNLVSPTLNTIKKNKSIKKIAVGESFYLVLTGDGTLFSWGNNEYGQLGTGDSDGVSPSAQKVRRGKFGIPFYLNIVDIAATRHTAYAVTNDGNLYYWGHNVLRLNTISPAEYNLPQLFRKDRKDIFNNRLVLSSKSLPSGLSIDPDPITSGNLIGAPTTTGSYESKIKIDYVDVEVIVPDKNNFKYKGTTYLTLPISVIEPPNELTNPNTDTNPNPNPNPNPSISQATTGSSTGEVELHSVPITTSSLTSSTKSVTVQFSTTRVQAGSQFPQTYKLKFGGVDILNSPFTFDANSATSVSLNVKISRTSSSVFKFETLIGYSIGGVSQQSRTISKNTSISSFSGTNITLSATNAAGSSAPIISNYNGITFQG